MRDKMRKSLNFVHMDKKLTRKEMRCTKGGYCGCACYYADSGGSSIDNNAYKNHDSGLKSPHPFQLIVIDF